MGIVMVKHICLKKYKGEITEFFKEAFAKYCTCGQYIKKAKTAYTY